MQVSVIVPVFNAEDTIRDCVTSILAQIFEDYELIVIDDGSTDHTSEILDDLSRDDARMRVVHQPNCGRSVARNVGIDAARGEWICFCDADDTMRPLALSILFNAAVYDACLVIAGMSTRETMEFESDGATLGTLRFDRASVIRDLVHARALSADADLSSVINWITLRSSCARLYRRSVLKLDNCVRFRKGVRYGEDALFNLDYLAHSAGVVVATAYRIYIYNQVQSSTIHSFVKADADALVPFYNSSIQIIGAIADANDSGVSHDDAKMFAGREVAAVLSRAARYGDGIKKTAALLEGVLDRPEIIEAWASAPLSHKFKITLRQLQVRLVRSGHLTLAFALQVAYVRMVDLVRA